MVEEDAIEIVRVAVKKAILDISYIIVHYRRMRFYIER